MGALCEFVRVVGDDGNTKTRSHEGPRRRRHRTLMTTPLQVGLGRCASYKRAPGRPRYKRSVFVDFGFEERIAAAREGGLGGGGFVLGSGGGEEHGAGDGEGG